MIGIYKIENLITGKIYIGQSVEVEERIKEHKRSQVYQDYKEKISLGAFNAIWYNQSWKGVI